MHPNDRLLDIVGLDDDFPVLTRRRVSRVVLLSRIAEEHSAALSESIDNALATARKINSRPRVMLQRQQPTSTPWKATLMKFCTWLVDEYRYRVAPEIRLYFWLAVVFCVVLIVVGITGVGLYDS